MSEKLLSLDEVCEILGKSPTTIKRYARENLLSSVEDGEELKFPEPEVMRYLEFSKRLG
ncbi:helix-turn-helix domain-containing protein [Shewanella sp. GXUN23E]|uniref:helix-turn-helix domain-containing protein n=1 Tax=Shewanella sp. GXUN23E TaxID=3422498 RepID=UPI003D7F0DF8